MSPIHRAPVANKATVSASPKHVWINGVILNADACHLSVFDRGFQLGDAVFETMRASAGSTMDLGQHLDRLRRSASELDIPLPTEAESQIDAGILTLLSAEGLDGADGNASIRITISRGSIFSRDLLPLGEDHPPTIAIQAWRLPLFSARHRRLGVRLVVSRVRRDPSNPLAAIKTTSRVEHIYARLEARRAGADDALFLTIHDHLSEATSANLFLIRRSRDGVVDLATPSLDCAILDGTTRAWVLVWARSVGLRPIEAHLSEDDLFAADEAFLSSSVAGIVPIIGFEGEPIGNGAPGPWALRARAEREAMFLGVESD